MIKELSVELVGKIAADYPSLEQLNLSQNGKESHRTRRHSANTL